MENVAVIKEQVDILLSLQKEYEELVSKSSELGKQIQNLKRSVIPAQLRALGLQSITTDDGYKVSLADEIHCSLRKSYEDQEICRNFLKFHGADHLIDEKLEVSIEDREALSEAGVPFKEVGEMNTIKVKAWLVSQTGLGGSPFPLIGIDDIPKSFGFIRMDTVKVEA